MTTEKPDEEKRGIAKGPKDKLIQSIIRHAWSHTKGQIQPSSDQKREMLRLVTELVDAVDRMAPVVIRSTSSPASEPAPNPLQRTQPGVGPSGSGSFMESVVESASAFVTQLIPWRAPLEKQEEIDSLSGPPSPIGPAQSEKTKPPSINWQNTALTQNGMSALRSSSLRVAFRIGKNATVGEYFEARVESSDEKARVIRIEDLVQAGLEYIPERKILKGTPSQVGRLQLKLRYVFERTTGRTQELEATCELTVNPNPSSLWKIVEPNTSEGNPKAHESSSYTLLKDGMFVVGASKRGRSHAHNGLFREDDFYIAESEDSGWTLMAVADGAGSASMSRLGSQIATKTWGDTLRASLEDSFDVKLTQIMNATPAPAEFDHEAKSLFMGAVSKALEEIERAAHEQNKPVRDFATTLLVCAHKQFDGQSIFVTYSVGDGAIALYSDSQGVKVLSAGDSGEFAGQTRFLDRQTLEDAAQWSKRFAVTRTPSNRFTALILITDGVADPLFAAQSDLEDSTAWDKFWQQIKAELRKDPPLQSLLDWLDFYKQGHHDDRTIVVLSNREQLNN